MQVSFISKYKLQHYGFLKNQFVVKQIKTNVQKYKHKLIWFGTQHVGKKKLIIPCSFLVNKANSMTAIAWYLDSFIMTKSL